MFKDHETIYVVASVLSLWLFTGLLTWYEIDYNTSDSPLQTAVAIAYGVGAAVGLTLLAIGTFEVVMVLAKRRDERLTKEAEEKGREEGRQKAQEELSTWYQALQAWYDSLPEDIQKKTPLPPGIK